MVLHELGFRQALLCAFHYPELRAKVVGRPFINKALHPLTLSNVIREDIHNVATQHVLEAFPNGPPSSSSLPLPSPTSSTPPLVPSRPGTAHTCHLLHPGNACKTMQDRKRSQHMAHNRKV